MFDPSSVFGAWDVESLRITLFYPPGANYSTRTDLWERVTGTRPETIDSKPREGVTRVIGSIGQNNLILSIQDGRIDWLVQPMLSPPSQQVSPLLMLKDVYGVFPILENAIGHSLETTKTVLRLAFGSALIKQASDPAEALKELSKYLSRLRMDFHEGSEFVYQVNRQRRSESVRHARINRLAKWSTAQAGGFEVQVEPTGQPHVKSANIVFIRRLDLDINTTPNTSAMSKDRIPALFGELVTLTGELATKGDIS